MVLVGMACGRLTCKIPIKSLAWSFGPRSVDLTAIKPLTLVLIGKQIVGARQLLEALLRLLVSGVEIRV